MNNMLRFGMGNPFIQPHLIPQQPMRLGAPGMGGAPMKPMQPMRLGMPQAGNKKRRGQMLPQMQSPFMGRNMMVGYGQPY